MHYTETMVDDMIQLDLEGKIDAVNCDEFQDIILKTFLKTNKVILNFEQIKYISSAGLKAIILGDKTAISKGGKLIIINVQSQVRDVFRVTGLESVLDIR